MVAGTPVSRRLVRRAAPRDGDDQSAWLSLRFGNLVRATGPGLDDEVEAYHDRVRESISARLPEDARRGCHLALANALEALGGADPESLAFHFEGGGDAVRAGTFYAAAADEAARALAFDHAARLYRRSLTLRPLAGRDLMLLRNSLAEALANAARGAEAAEEFLAAARDATAEEVLRARARAFRAYVSSGHLAEAYALLPEMLRSVGESWPKGPRRALAAYLFKRLRLAIRGLRFTECPPELIPVKTADRLAILWTLGTYLCAFDAARGITFQASHLLLALQTGATREVIRGLNTDAIIGSGVGSRARPRCERLLKIAASYMAPYHDDAYLNGTNESAWGFIAFFTGRYREALVRLDRSEQIFRTGCTGMDFELGNVCEYGLRCLTELGELADLGRRLPPLLRDAAERNDLKVVMNLGTDLLAFHRLAEDDPEGCEAELTRNEAKWTYQGVCAQRIHWSVAVVLIKLYLGDGRAAWEHLRTHWPAYEGSLFAWGQQTRSELLHFRARSALALAATLPPRDAAARALLRLARGCARRLFREGTVVGQAHARGIQAALAALRGNDDQVASSRTLRGHVALRRGRVGVVRGGDPEAPRRVARGRTGPRTHRGRRRLDDSAVDPTPRPDDPCPDPRVRQPGVAPAPTVTQIRPATRRGAGACLRSAQGHPPAPRSAGRRSRPGACRR